MPKFPLVNLPASVIFAMAICFLATDALAQWSMQVSRDEMTHEVAAYATSDWVSPRRQMSFPYGHVRAVMGVGCKGSSEWAYIRFNEAPNITNPAIENGYNRIRARVRWDDNVENMNFTQTWGGKSIQFRNSSQAIKKIETSSSVLLELSWYGSGNVYFEFPLGGSAEAIEKARQSCR